MNLKNVGRKGAANFNGLLTLVLIVAGVVFIGTQMGWLGTQASTTGGQSTSGQSSTLACAATTVTFTNQNALAKGTAPGEYTRVFVGGADKGYVAEGGTLTLTGGDSVVAYHALNSTTAGTGYYTTKDTFTIPCTGAAATYIDSAPIYQYDNGLTLSYKNKNGQVVTGQHLAANTKYDLPVSIMSGSQKAYGDPQLAGKTTNAICFQYNSTLITTMSWLIGGTTQNVVATPRSQASNNTVTGQDTIQCFSLPMMQNTQQVDGVLHLETGSTASIDANTINVTTEDANYYLDSNTLAEGIGFQNNAGTDLGFRGIFLLPIDLTS